MRSSKQQQSNHNVLMRRLKPLYDLVDQGDNKGAISNADKLLKKHPQMHAASALKALALIRSERFDEAEGLLEVLKSVWMNGENDEQFVEAYIHCEKELNRPENIVGLYTKLNEQRPKNEALMRSLFLAHVRCGNFDKQQRVALELANMTEQSTYFVWAVLTMLVKGFQNTQPNFSKLLFELANRTLSKMVSDEALMQHQGGLDVRLMALEAVGNYDDAIALIRKQSKLTLNLHILHRLRRLYQLSERHTELFDLCMDSVENSDPNEWSNWKLLVDSFLHLPDTDGSFLSLIVEKMRLLSEKRENRRTLLLAKLFLVQKLSSAKFDAQRKFVEQKIGSPFDLQWEAIRGFHDRPSTFMDLKIFLHLLTSAEQKELLRRISAISGNGANDHVDDGDVLGCSAMSSKSVAVSSSIWTFLLGEMISSFCFHPSTLSDQELKDSVRRLLGELTQIHRFCANDMAIAVFAHLISNYCWEFFVRTGDYNLLVLLLSFLEVLNKQSECNALIPILLCRFYAIFGTIERINELVKQMDIKFVLRINFAFLLCFVAENFGQFQTACNYHASMVNLQKANTKEIRECIVTAFRNEKYLQIANSYDFLQNCQNSVYFFCSGVQWSVLTACFESPSLETASNALTMNGDFDLERIVDTREFSAVKMFLSDATLSEMREETLKEIKAYLRLRIALGNAINSIGEQTLAQNANAFFTTLAECREQFATAPKIRNLLENFTDTRIELLLSRTIGEQSVVQLPVLVLNAALDTANSADDGDEQQQQQKKDQQRQQQRLDEVAAQFSTLLNDFFAYFDRQPAHLSLEERTAVARNGSKLIEMIAFALIGVKRLERLLPSPSASTIAKNENDGTGKKESQRGDRKSSGKKRGEKQQQHGGQQQQKLPQGLFSRAIHQTLQHLRTFFVAKSLPSELGGSSALSEEQDQFGLRKMCSECMEGINAVEAEVRERISAADSFCQIVDTLDRLIQFSCL